jgi:hypothetical protein
MLLPAKGADMNRIMNTNKERKIATDIAAKPKKCAFCDKALTSESKKFMIFSLNSDDVVMCASCLAKYAVLSQTEGLYRTWCRRESWSGLENRLFKNLAGEGGTTLMKKAAVAIVLRLAQRSAAVFGGCKAKGLDECPVTHVSLSACKIAFVGKNAKACLGLIEAACRVCGLPTQRATQATSGQAEWLLADKYNNDPCYAHCGVLLSEQAYKPTQEDTNLVIACATDAPRGFTPVPVDGYDPADIS